MTPEIQEAIECVRLDRRNMSWRTLSGALIYPAETLAAEVTRLDAAERKG